jgi:hypothetical protein
MLARSPEDDHLLSRVAVCRLLLGAIARIPQDSFDPQFGLSSTDEQPNRASEPNPRGYAKGLCDGISRELDKNLSWVEFSYNNSY